MKKILFIVTAVFLLILAGVCSGCEDDYVQAIPPPPQLDIPRTDSPFALGEPVYDGFHNGGEYVLTYGSFPKINGNDACLPLAYAFARKHIGLSNDDLEDFCGGFGSPYAVIGMLNNSTSYDGALKSLDIVMERACDNLILGEEPDEYAHEYASERDMELISSVFAMDSLVLFVPAANPVESLTPEQIKGIYSGKITNWKEVGGEDVPITAYQNSNYDPDNEARKALFKVMEGESFMEAPSHEVSISSSGVTGEDGYSYSYLQSYEDGPDSLGFGLLSLMKDDDSIKPLKVDGIPPLVDGQPSADYPLLVPYYVTILAADVDGNPGKFVEWMLSDEGRECIASAGFLLPAK